MIDHLLDIGSPDEARLPDPLRARRAVRLPARAVPGEHRRGPRTDIDTAADLPFEERFQHYVDRYPAFKRIMDTHELIESPTRAIPSYISYTDLVQHSDRYAGDGWLLIGDAAYFVNPLYSPGMTYGHSLASFAARETVSALERGDLSEQAFATSMSAARGLYSALATECEFFYRSFRHPDAFERAFMFRPAFFISLGGGKGQAVRRRLRHAGHVPDAADGSARRADHGLALPGAAAAGDRRRARAGGERCRARRDGAGRQARSWVRCSRRSPTTESVADLGLGEAFQNYNDRLERVPRKEGYDSLTPT